MADSPVEDVELVERVRRGELDAFGTLVQRYQDLALRVAYLITGDFAEAEDATQEAFLKVYASLDRFRLDAPFRPWLLRIVANEARNVRTATRRRAGLLARSSDQLPSRGHAPSPEGAVLANEQHRVLVRALEDLREDDRLAISYRYFFDLSESEMVSALGWSRGTVKSRLSRALGRYRQRLGELALLPIGVFAFPHLARTLAGLDPVHLEGALSDLSAHLPALPPHDLAQALGPGAGGSTPGHGSSPPPALALAAVGAALLAAVLMVATPVVRSGNQPRLDPSPVVATSSAASQPLVARASPVQTTATSAGQAFIILGGDLTDAERTQLLSGFGAGDTSVVNTVGRDEMIATLRAAGLPASATDQAISSLAVACRQRRAGLQVHTEHITLVPALAYATALLVADGANASVIVAAPASKPVSGETAMIGAVRAAWRCQGDTQPDAARLQLAVDQLRATSDLAEATGDWATAATVLAHATQAVVTGRAREDAAIGAAVEAAAAEQGVTVDAALNAQLVATLRQLAGRDFGDYAAGYRIEQTTPNDVQIVPSSNSVAAPP